MKVKCFTVAVREVGTTRDEYEFNVYDLRGVDPIKAEKAIERRNGAIYGSVMVYNMEGRLIVFHDVSGEWEVYPPEGSLSRDGYFITSSSFEELMSAIEGWYNCNVVGHTPVTAEEEVELADD